MIRILLSLIHIEMCIRDRDVTFVPAGDVDATDVQMQAAQTVINDRLVGLGITDYESYVDANKDRIIVRFPWKSDESDFDPQQAIDEIGTTAEMVFREGSTADGDVILTGDQVESALSLIHIFAGEAGCRSTVGTAGSAVHYYRV